LDRRAKRRRERGYGSSKLRFGSGEKKWNLLVNLLYLQYSLIVTAVQYT
jgi:hypothetical protein